MGECESGWEMGRVGSWIKDNNSINRIRDQGTGISEREDEF